LYLTEHNYCAREIGIKQPLFGVLSRNIRIHLFQQNVGEKARTVPAFRSSNSSVRAFGWRFSWWSTGCHPHGCAQWPRWRALSPSVSRESMEKGEGPYQIQFMQQRHFQKNAYWRLIPN